MTPEERKRYDEWKRTHKPGPPGPRAAERARRKQNRDAKNLLAMAEKRPAATVESQELAKAINGLEQKLERLRQPAAVDPETDDTVDIFG